MILKNQDYAKADDPLKNFRKRGLLGMLVRLEDKMARLDTFVETGILAVSSEPVEDVFKDIINYAILMRYWISEEREKAKLQSEIQDWKRQADAAYQQNKQAFDNQKQAIPHVSTCGCGGTFTAEGGWFHGDNCKAWPFYRGPVA